MEINVKCPFCNATKSWVVNGDSVYCNSCGNNSAEFSISELIRNSHMPKIKEICDALLPDTLTVYGRAVEAGIKSCHDYISRQQKQ